MKLKWCVPQWGEAVLLHAAKSLLHGGRMTPFLRPQKWYLRIIIIGFIIIIIMYITGHEQQTTMQPKFPSTYPFWKTGV